MLLVAGADDDGVHARFARDPVQCGLGDGNRALGGDFGKGIDDSVEPLLIDGAGRVETVQPRLGRLRLAAAEFAGQKAELQGAPGHNARTLVKAGGHQFVLGVAGQQRIVDLLRDVALNPEPVRGGQGLHELPARVVGATGVADLTGADQILEGAQSLVQGCEGVEVVGLVEIDVIGSQTAEARVAGFQDVAA